ncbi:uncharacterized protein METZ01_LOCUS226306, partial [marine metagenome]
MNADRGRYFYIFLFFLSVYISKGGINMLRRVAKGWRLLHTLVI